MITQELCDFLEHYLTAALSKSADIDRRRCWCDGIFLPDLTTGYSIDKMLGTRQILTRAWIDEGKIKGEQRGQFLYDLTIKFGDKTIACYKKDLNLIHCLPDQNNDDWIFFNRETRKIELQLR